MSDLIKRNPAIHGGSINPPKFSWRQWKMGLLVAIVASLLVAGAGIASGATWPVFLSTFCAALLTHGGTYLKQHPIEDVIETKTVVHTDVQQTTTTTSQTPPAKT